MTTMALSRQHVTGGVDTHRDIHVAAAVDPVGGVLGTASFPTTPAGHRALARWLTSFGPVDRVGVEGTGSYGSSLARHLTQAGHQVLEVSRPNRQVRRRHGKTDIVDAIAAARAVLSGEANATPKTHDGPVEALRTLKMVQRSATKARTQAVNQLRALVLTAPDDLRARLRDLPRRQLIATCAGFRIAGDDDGLNAITRLALRELAQRIQVLESQLHRVVARLRRITTVTAPDLLARKGVGPDTAATLLVTAGDNPDRLHHERSFASLCGSSPVPVNSGQTQHRYRLNRGGDRNANAALWRIAIVRMATDPDTRNYIASRLADGKTKSEAIRCLKRYIAREIFNALPRAALV
jgi:transposase